MVQRAWIGMACLATTVAAAAATPDSKLTTAGASVPPAAARFAAGADSLPAGSVENPDLPDSLPDSLLDLDVLLESLQAMRARLADPDRGVFDELVDAAREMAAGGDEEAARLLVADARRLVAAPRPDR